MSDSVLSIVPDDPHWQPGPEAGRATGDLVAELTLADGDGGWHEVDWHDQITLVDCGVNLEHIRCPHCRQELQTSWFQDRMEERYVSGAGFTSLDLVTPCCQTATTLNALDYDWPMAFAKFEIAIWNGSRLWQSNGDGLLDPASLTAVETVLGHPIRQVRAHY